jgi:hypothetical protein
MVDISADLILSRMLYSRLAYLLSVLLLLVVAGE